MDSKKNATPNMGPDDKEKEDSKVEKTETKSGEPTDSKSPQVDSNVADTQEDKKTESASAVSDVKNEKPEVVEASNESEVKPVMSSVEETAAPNLNQPANLADLSSDISDPEVIDSVDMGYTKTSSNKMLYILVFILGIILLSLVGLFFYRQYINTTGEATTTPTPTQVEAQKPSPSETPVNDEDKQLQGITVNGIDEEVAGLEQDISGL